MDNQILNTSWTEEPAGSWQLAEDNSSFILPYVSANGTITNIDAGSVKENENAAIHAVLDPPIDIEKNEELRFWFKSNRRARTDSKTLFYLAFEIANDTLNQKWKWFLPVSQQNTWEFHTLWLKCDDMPQGLLKSVTRLTLVGIDKPIPFYAAMGDVLAVTPRPLLDVDNALEDQLTKLLPVIWELPEKKLDRTLPYILITPWSVQPGGELASSRDIVDNYVDNEIALGRKQQGMYVRPVRKQVHLEYSIDVFAEERSQKIDILDQIISIFYRQPFLVVNAEPVTITPFIPSPEQVADNISPGRTPVFYRLSVGVETGTRRFQSRTLTTKIITEHEDNRTLLDAKKEQIHF